MGSGFRVQGLIPRGQGGKLSWIDPTHSRWAPAQLVGQDLMCVVGPQGLDLLRNCQLWVTTFLEVGKAST